jgi:hypothetical protein
VTEFERYERYHYDVLLSDRERTIHEGDCFIAFCPDASFRLQNLIWMGLNRKPLELALMRKWLDGLWVTDLIVANVCLTIGMKFPAWMLPSINFDLYPMSPSNAVRLKMTYDRSEPLTTPGLRASGVLIFPPTDGR